MEKLDLVLINPGDKKQIYQGLGLELAAIEPPFWVAVIAAYLRNQGFRVEIIDANAENYTPEETAEKVAKLNPLLAAVIVYGSHPSASTQTMPVSGKICEMLTDKTSSKVAIGGLHPTALPKRTIEEERVDYVIEGEGPYTLESLLEVLRSGSSDFTNVPGLWFRDDDKSIKLNSKASLIDDLDKVLPVAAWDLLPMNKYRAHNWHCFDDIQNRMPYGAIYTSLGCPFSCTFCCINALFGKPGIRYRSPELVVEEIGLLVEEYDVKNIKIVDELFVLKESHYMTIVDLIIQKGYDLNIWAYARIDTIKAENLKKMKQAGINWLGLGIESANNNVLDDINKKINAEDITNIVRQIQSADIRVGANFIFGLPEDNQETMNQSLELAFKLNAEYANFYCTMAYPGSKLYESASKEGWPLPKRWSGYSQYAEDSLPLPTKHLSAAEVLSFRDDAFQSYFNNPKYLDIVSEKFGKKVKDHIQEMTKTKLKRDILDN